MKTVLTIVIVAALASCLAITVGCNASQAAAQTLISLQAATDTYLAIYEPNFANKAKLDDAFTKAIADVAAFKPGTPGSEVSQALQDLAGALDDIPLNGQTDAAIAAGINFITNEIALIESEKSASVAEQDAVFYAWLTDEAPTTTARKHVWTGKPVKSPKSLKKAWNKAAPKAKLQ